MTLKFEAPNFDPKAEKKRQSEQVLQTIQSITPLMLHHQEFKRQQELAALQHDIDKQKLAMQLREMQAKYGTGEEPPLQAGTYTPGEGGPEEQWLMAKGTPPTLAPESPEETFRRIGAEGYKALNPPPTNIVSPTGDILGQVQGKAAVLPNPPKPGEKKNEMGLTPGQIQTDKEFAKDYEEFTARGGYADVQKNLTQLREVSDKLAVGEAKTGKLSGALSKLPFTKARATKEAVQEVVQRNLRLILGAQFTEREGNALISRAYNEFQTPEENKKRLDRLIKQIDDAAKAKQRAGEYFEENGTLKGYKGTSYTFTPSKAGIPSVGETFQGGKVLNIKRIE